MPSAHDMLGYWKKFSGSGIGRKAFSAALGIFVPYASSVHPEIMELERGKCIVRIRDRRSIRNHLQSVHAMALAHASELVTGLATMSLIDKKQRAILTEFNIKYIKKARGILSCVAVIPPETVPEGEGVLNVEAEIFDSAGDCVTKATAQWKIGLHPKSS